MRNLSIFLGFLLGALVLTYPLVRHPLSHIPLGAEPAGTVPLFNLWTLQWNIDQLRQGYPHYWDAPIFAPNTGTFAFSEIQPVTALLAAPLWLVAQAPALGYNAVVILFLTLNGWFSYALLRGWGASPLVAFWTGLLMQALPGVAQEMGVLQLLTLFGFLWTLFFLDRWLRRPTWSNVVALAVGPPVTFLTCGYYGLLSLIFLPLALPFLLLNHSAPRTENDRPRRWLGLLAAVGLAAGLTGPLVVAQQQQLDRYGFSRSDRTIENNSARLVDYAKPLDYNLFYGHLLGLTSEPGQRLFPGLVLISLGLTGLGGKPRRAIKVYLLVAIIVAFFLSLGLRLEVGAFQPYAWLRAVLPGFEQLRSPFRFAYFAQLHLALLAGFGLMNLEAWLNRSSRFSARALAGKLLPAGVALLAVSEALALPLPLLPLPDLETGAAWQAWINRQPGTPTLVMLPFAASPRAADFEQTVIWMLVNRDLDARMVNGYSGFFPREHARLREAMTRFPSEEGLNLLRQSGVDLVIIYHSLSNIPATGPDRLVPVYADPRQNVSIYRLQ
ncbi:MAG TPA: hypothetical protein PKD98_19445 [Anaerolineae bacterium]|nr:hypothetical protein [Anaerolineae bacterium]